MTAENNIWHAVHSSLVWADDVSCTYRCCNAEMLLCSIQIQCTFAIWGRICKSSYNHKYISPDTSFAKVWYNL